MATDRLSAPVIKAGARDGGCAAPGVEKFVPGSCTTTPPPMTGRVRVVGVFDGAPLFWGSSRSDQNSMLSGSLSVQQQIQGGLAVQRVEKPCLSLMTMQLSSRAEEDLLLAGCSMVDGRGGRGACRRDS